MICEPLEEERELPLVVYWGILEIYSENKIILENQNTKMFWLYHILNCSYIHDIELIHRNSLQSFTKKGTFVQSIE